MVTMESYTRWYVSIVLQVDLPVMAVFGHLLPIICNTGDHGYQSMLTTESYTRWYVLLTEFPHHLCVNPACRSIFLCDRWLAVEEDDGMVDRILPVAGIEDLIAFKHLFTSSARKKMANDHLWLSVFSRPTRSNFTRVQRLSLIHI